MSDGAKTRDGGAFDNPNQENSIPFSHQSKTISLQENDAVLPKAIGEAAISPYHIKVDNRMYLTTALAEKHPGGQYIVKLFSGVDATRAFLSYHRRPFPHDKVSL